MYDHPDHHKPSEKPVANCPKCDEDIERPIKLCFGTGSSNSVIPKSGKKDK